MPGNFNLERFLTVQDPMIAQVMQELGAGKKRGYWMWYIFPQLAGLGQNLISAQYAISSIAEARAYLTHRVLGKRLIDCTRMVNKTDSRSALAVFGSPDDIKFHSSMTLFDRVHPGFVFREAMDIFFHAKPEVRTLALLNGPASGRN